jgi:uncharacterized Zn finger protein
MMLYCEECDKFIEITKHNIYREGGDLYVECHHCGDREEV